MVHLKPWLLPRVAFWLIWTAWLWCLRSFLLAQLEVLPGHMALLYIAGPPVLIAWVGSRVARNPLESPNALFWKGAALSCLLAGFAKVFLMKEIGWELHLLAGAGLLCGYLGLRGHGIKKVALTQGDLFERARFIGWRSGVSVRSVLVFKSPRDLPSAFAQRNAGAILLSDRLLRLLSRRETEAVMAHEAAHLRPMQRMVVSAVLFFVGPAILLNSFWLELGTVMPFLPVSMLLLWRALKRMQEYDADAHAVRATGDPEALIAALTRISFASNIPLHWGPGAGLFLPHPPMSARFRSIARKGGINLARVDELVSSSRVIPPLPGFASPFDQAKSAEGILITHRKRLSKRLAVLSKLFPILAGAAFAGAARALAPDVPGLILLTLAWCGGSMIVFWIAYEVIVGAERRRLRGELPEADRRRSYFTGFSTAGEPRYYEGLYHYDLGVVRIHGGSLRFTGTRCSFSLGSSEARRVWLASGPRHWTPRKMVCIAYQLDDGKTGIASLQSLERWFWPGTSAAAQQLFAALTQWSKNGEPLDEPTSPPPQAGGEVVPRITAGALWNAVKVPCLVSLCVSWFIVQNPNLGPKGILTPFAASLVTGILLFFILAPHLNWSHVRSEQSPPAQPSAYPEAE